MRLPISLQRCRLLWAALLLFGSSLSVQANAATYSIEANAHELRTIPVSVVENTILPDVLILDPAVKTSIDCDSYAYGWADRACRGDCTPYEYNYHWQTGYTNCQEY